MTSKTKEYLENQLEEEASKIPPTLNEHPTMREIRVFAKRSAEFNKRRYINGR